MWLSSIFGKKRHGNPRDILRDALQAMANAALVEQALNFYDNPEPFVDFAADEAGSFPSWAEDERDPMPDELAEAVFQAVLLANDYVKMIDWADGPDTILDAYDVLLKARGLLPLGVEVRQRATQDIKLTELTERGGAYSALTELLHNEANARGFEVAHLIAGQDAHFPMLVPADVYHEWQSKAFGKGRPVFAY